MSDTATSVYRERLLQLARDHRHRGPMPHADRRGRAVNPLCGDELLAELTLRAEAQVDELRWTVRGCAVTEAAAHLLAELAPGADQARLARWQSAFEASLGGAALPPELSSLEPLLVLRQRPNRHACALLPWHALSEALTSRG